MKTPYDALIRIRRREIDEIKLSIGIEMRRIDANQAAQEELVEEVEAECIAAAEEWHISTTAFLRDRSRRNARLIIDREEQEAQLARLRERAGEIYGSLRVSERAAEAHRAAAKRAEANREQTEADDLTSARRLLAERRAAFRARRDIPRCW